MIVFLSSIRTQIFLILILFILACAVIFRIVATDQARMVLLTERAEKINDINSRMPDVFKIILESSISDFKANSLPDKINTKSDLDTHLRTFLKSPMQDRISNLAKVYDSSYFGFYPLDGPLSGKDPIFYESNSYKGHMWYPRQVKLSYYFADLERWSNTAFIDKWYPPVTLGVVAQSYEKLDKDLVGIENSINTPTVYVLIVGVLFALLLSVIISSRIVRLKKSILNLSKDLGKTIPPVGGELGDIADAANRLAMDLRSSRSRSERVLDSVSTGIIVVGSNLRIIEANPSSLDIIGKTRAEVVGNPFMDFGDVGQLVSGELTNVVEKGNVWSSGTLKTTTSSGVKYVNLIAVPVENSKPKEAIIAISDVTENVTDTMRNERDASLARLGLFTMGVAHEVRNPLTSIKGFVQLLDRKLVGKDEGKYLRPVLKEIERIENLITELMNASKPQPLKVELVSFQDIATQLATNNKEQLDSFGIAINLVVPENLELQADPNRLYQVLLNLLLNSRDAMPAGGTVTISARLENDWVVIDFSDTGMGISQDDVHKIFTPFFTTKASGTGLGLSICDQIIKAHGGRISFVSDDTGTVFTIRLPLKPAMEE